MKVRMLRNAAKHYGVTLREGEEGEVSGDAGQLLVAANIAICLDAPPQPEPVIQAVEPEVTAEVTKADDSKINKPFGRKGR